METLKLLQKLISFPSVTRDKAQVNRCSDFVAGYLRSNGLFVRVEKHNGYKIVYAATHKGKKSDVILNAHIDVVAAPPALFKLRIKGRRLYARGAIDCKGAVAVIMNTLAGLKGNTKVGAIFSADEEEGGLTTRYMVQKGYAGRLALVLDGNMQRLTLAQKGIISMTLHAKGRACHSATPWRGENAIEKLVEGYGKIKALFPKGLTEKNNWHNTLALTIIQGGTVRNVVPETAAMTLNIRFTEKTDPMRLVRRIEKASGCAAQIHLITPFVSVSEKDPLVRAFLSAMRTRLFPKVIVSRMNGATDARYFISSTPSVAITGLLGKNAHSVDEYLEIASLRRLEGFLSAYLTEKNND